MKIYGGGEFELSPGSTLFVRRKLRWQISAKNATVISVPAQPEHCEMSKSAADGLMKSLIFEK